MFCKKLFQLHSWGKWRDVGKYDIEATRIISGKGQIKKELVGIVGQAIRQERRCKRCDIIQLRTEKAYTCQKNG